MIEYMFWLTRVVMLLYSTLFCPCAGARYIFLDIFVAITITRVKFYIRCGLAFYSSSVYVSTVLKLPWQG